MKINQNNPYKGLFKYTAADEGLFFGREQEVRDLLEMIQTKQLVTLYGESGTGKTSLINAKLFPELNRKYFFTVIIRINYASEDTPLQQVRDKVNAELGKFSNQEADMLFEDTATLLESASKICLFDGMIKPVLFFDQFEELFTLGPKFQRAKDLHDFIEQLSDLVEVRADKIAGPVESIPLLQDSGPVGSTATASLADVRLATSASQVRNASNFRTVLSLRQDSVGYLDDLKFDIPSLLYGKYHLKKFTIAQARQAICGPLNKLPVDGDPDGIKLSTENVRLIIDQLNTGIANELIADGLNDKSSTTAKAYIGNGVIDPTLLSLFCYEVFNKSISLLIDGGTATQSTEMPNDYNVVFKQVISAANVDETIEQYYEKHSAHLPQLKQAIEQNLINKDGKRVLINFNKFSEHSEIDAEQIRAFVDESALLRLYGEEQNKEKEEVEIVHDQIANYVLKSKERRIANEQAALVKLEADEKAAIVKKEAAEKAAAVKLGAIIIASIIAAITVLYVYYQGKTVDIKTLQQEKAMLIRKSSALDSTNQQLERAFAADKALHTALITKRNEALQMSAKKEASFQATINALQTTNATVVAKNSTLAKQLADEKVKVKYDRGIIIKNSNAYNVLARQADSLQVLVFACREKLSKANSEIESLGNRAKLLRGNPAAPGVMSSDTKMKVVAPTNSPKQSTRSKK